eukprot:1153220-Pelagomonas_calceolata.AAC.3
MICGTTLQEGSQILHSRPLGSAGRHARAEKNEMTGLTSRCACWGVFTPSARPQDDRQATAGSMHHKILLQSNCASQDSAAIKLCITRLCCN